MRENKFRYIFEDIKEDGRTLVAQFWNLNYIETNDIVYDTEVLVARNQYTELKDKNGVEIYEGDIIKDKFGIILGVVKYGKYKLSKFTKFDNQHHHIGFYIEKDSFNIQSLEEMCWYINESGNPIRTNNIQVVGNIYENPDLLKG